MDATGGRWQQPDHNAVTTPGTSTPRVETPSTRAQGVATAYDRLAAAYARLLPDARAEQPLDLAMLDDFTARLSGNRRVLDGGCGTGRMLAELLARDAAATGCDVSPEMVAHARRRYPTLAIEIASLDHLPFPNEEFDGVLLWYSLIHTPLPEWSSAVNEVLRVLRPGGIVLLGFQEGTGEQDLRSTYRALGHEVTLSRWRVTLDQAAVAWAGTTELARLCRAPAGQERDRQGFLLLAKDS